MLARNSIILAVAVIATVTLITSSDPIANPKVLAIMMDGFRWDYVDITPNTPNFDFMARTGVKAAMIPVFPANTFPNEFTIHTGLYPQYHGIVDNYMYDPDTDETMIRDWPMAMRWIQAEPLMVTLKNAGKRPLMLPLDMMNLPPLLESTQDAINAFVNDTADFVMLYSKYPSEVTHYLGPDEFATSMVVQRMDALLGMIFDAFRKAGILNDINVAAFGDHGVAAAPRENSIDVEECLGDLVENVKIIGSSIHVLDENVDDVYDALVDCDEHMQVYRKWDLPDRFQYSNNSRIGEIVMVIDEGWHRISKDDPSDFLFTVRNGYDFEYPSMHSLFCVRGPHFKRNYTSPPISIVHMNELARHVMGVPSAPGNGSFDAVKHIIAATLVL